MAAVWRAGGGGFGNSRNFRSPSGHPTRQRQVALTRRGWGNLRNFRYPTNASPAGVAGGNFGDFCNSRNFRYPFCHLRRIDRSRG
jgi:hypothetical protein